MALRAQAIRPVVRTGEMKKFIIISPLYCVLLFTKAWQMRREKTVPVKIFDSLSPSVDNIIFLHSSCLHTTLQMTWHQDILAITLTWQTSLICFTDIHQCQYIPHDWSLRNKFVFTCCNAIRNIYYYPLKTFRWTDASKLDLIMKLSFISCVIIYICVEV